MAIHIGPDLVRRAHIGGAEPTRIYAGASVVHVRPLALYRPGDVLPPGSVYTRASPATFIDANGNVQNAASGVLRDGHYINGERTTLIEAARTNLLPASATGHGLGDGWTGWIAFSGATLTRTVGRADPFGGTGAVRMQTLGGSSVLKLVASSTVVPSTGQSQSGSIWIRAYTRTMQVHSNQDGVNRFINPAEGWVKFTYAVQGNGVGIPQFQFRGANDEGTQPAAEHDVDVDVFQPQIEAGTFPSSFTPGGTTRAADRLELPFPHVPQEMTVYSRNIELGNGQFAPGGASFLWCVGQVPVRFQVAGVNGNYNLTHNNGSLVTSRPFPQPAYGSALEVSGVLQSNGGASPSTSVDGGAVVVSVATGFPPLVPAWTGAPTVHLGSILGTNVGFAAFTHLHIVPGVWPLATMRMLAGRHTQ